MSAVPIIEAETLLGSSNSLVADARPDSLETPLLPAATASVDDAATALVPAGWELGTKAGKGPEGVAAAKGNKKRVRKVVKKVIVKKNLSVKTKGAATSKAVDELAASSPPAVKPDFETHAVPKTSDDGWAACKRDEFSSGDEASDSDCSIEDVCTRAVKLEVNELNKLPSNLSALAAFDSLLQDVFLALRPKPIDYEHRNNLIHTFNIMARDVLGNCNGFPVVEPFGSFTMDLFTAKSDLDLSVNFNGDNINVFPRSRTIYVIRQLARRLYSHQKARLVSGVFPITRAKVPVLKVADLHSGVECDISVENKEGITRSAFTKAISSIDERFQKLSYLVKLWANVHSINSAKNGTMSSMSIVSLVAFHLQTRRPPILPPFSTLLKDGIDLDNIQKIALMLNGFGKENKESVAELFVSLMCKLSAVRKLWRRGLCASTYEGMWISKTWGNSSISILNVEDFLDRSQNFARCVQAFKMRTIRKCLRDTVASLSRFIDGQMESQDIKTALFGSLDQNGVVDGVRVNHVVEVCMSKGKKAQRKNKKAAGKPSHDVMITALLVKNSSDQSHADPKVTAAPLPGNPGSSQSRSQVRPKLIPPLQGNNPGSGQHHLKITLPPVAASLPVPRPPVAANQSEWKITHKRAKKRARDEQTHLTALPLAPHPNASNGSFIRFPGHSPLLVPAASCLPPPPDPTGYHHQHIMQLPQPLPLALQPPFPFAAPVYRAAVPSQYFGIMMRPNNYQGTYRYFHQQQPNMHQMSDPWAGRTDHVGHFYGNGRHRM